MIHRFIRKLLVYTSYRAINYKKAEIVQDLASKSNNMDRYKKLASVYFPIQSGAIYNDVRSINKLQRIQRNDQVIEEEEDADEFLSKMGRGIDGYASLMQQASGREERLREREEAHQT